MLNVAAIRISVGVLAFFLFAVGSYSQTYTAPSMESQKPESKSVFTQDKVDKVILEHYQDKNCIIEEKNAANPLLYNVCQNSVSLSGGLALPDDDIIFAEDRDVLYIGPGPDTFFVTSDYEQVGDIIVHGYGTLLVDNATLSLSGHLYQQDNSRVILRNGAYLHVLQQFNSNYLHFLHDSAYFEATDSRIYANTVYQIRHYGNSEYIARQTEFPNWNYHRLWNSSKLLLEDAGMVGDLQINDSCEIQFTRCDTIMPWLGVADGDSINLQFPDYSTVEHFEFNSDLPGVTGIDYSVTFNSCHVVMWGVESWAGSYISIYNTNFLGLPFRIVESDTLTNIRDYEIYPYLSFPFNDRFCEITNTYLNLWFPYTYSNAVVYIDSCSYGESHACENSELYITNTTADGLPSSASATDNGFFSFKDGYCRTFTGSWHNATLLLVNTTVIPKPRSAQLTNLAHGNSYFLAVNCYFEYEPEARDTALVMFTAIDSLSDDTVGVSIDISGSAWIDVDTCNTITFDRYKLFWSHAEDTLWTLINESTDQPHNDILALWNTSGFSDGDYDLRLTIWDSVGDSLTAFREITLLPAGSFDYLPGDVNMYNSVWPPSVIGGDVTYLVNFFRGIAASQPCLLDGFWCSADANGDCVVIGSDVIRLVNYFRGIGIVEYCPDYEPSWPTPDDLPDEAPEGWPGCE